MPECGCQELYRTPKVRTLSVYEKDKRLSCLSVSLFWRQFFEALEKDLPYTQKQDGDQLFDSKRAQFAQELHTGRLWVFKCSRTKHIGSFPQRFSFGRTFISAFHLRSQHYLRLDYKRPLMVDYGHWRISSSLLSRCYHFIKSYHPLNSENTFTAITF